MPLSYYSHCIRLVNRLIKIPLGKIAPPTDTYMQLQIWSEVSHDMEQNFDSKEKQLNILILAEQTFTSSYLLYQCG